MADKAAFFNDVFNTGLNFVGSTSSVNPYPEVLPVKESPGKAF